MDRIIKTTVNWALASDGIQWILMRRHPRSDGPDTWDPVSYVRSTKAVLARCMRGAGAGRAVILLAGLPDSFDEWKSLYRPDVGILSALPASTKPHWPRFKQLCGPPLSASQLHCAGVSDRNYETGYSSYLETEEQNRWALE